MARPIKKGLDYYPMDTDFLHDMKVRKIMRANGAAAISILICLLGNIYRDEGYYMKWDEDARFLVADEVGAKESYVDEVVAKAVQVGLFDSEMFSGLQVLTSHGIQTRYKKAATQKADNSIDPQFNLLEEVSKLDNRVSKTGNPSKGVVSNAENTQRKEKKSKVNKSKEKETETTTPASYSAHDLDAIATRNSIKDQQMQPLRQYYETHIGEVGIGIGVFLEQYVDKTSAYVVAQALVVAYNAGKSDWSYVRGVLDNWVSAGIKTKSDYIRVYGQEEVTNANSNG